MFTYSFNSVQLTYWASAHMISHPHNWIFVTGANLGIHLCLYQNIEHNEQEWLLRGREYTPFLVLTRGDNERRAQSQWKKRRPRLLCSYKLRTRDLRQHGKRELFSRGKEEDLVCCARTRLPFLLNVDKDVFLYLSILLVCVVLPRDHAYVGAQ